MWQAVNVAEKCDLGEQILVADIEREVVLVYTFLL